MSFTEKWIKVDADVIRMIAAEIDMYEEATAQETMTILIKNIERLQKGE